MECKVSLRLSFIQKSGTIHVQEPLYFQVVGENPEIVGEILQQLTHTGQIPEALRLAHLIGKALITGESGKRA